ncbi:MAG: hypothetical protein IPL73_16440 [Candidatus Obscuribacter sp.]|nr:hypothetical protein [Candidatus Obscuribacter sp.]
MKYQSMTKIQIPPMMAEPQLSIVITDGAKSAKHQLYARNKHLENPSQYQSKAQRADSKETHQKSHNPTGDNKQYAANKTSDNTTMDLNTRYKEGKNYSKNTAVMKKCPISFIGLNL